MLVFGGGGGGGIVRHTILIKTEWLCWVQKGEGWEVDGYAVIGGDSELGVAGPSEGAMIVGLRFEINWMQGEDLLWMLLVYVIECGGIKSGE